jgi:hypothetical protein
MYPRDFREQHGDEMLQLARDRRTHGGERAWRLWPSIIADTALTAPKLQLGRIAMHHKLAALIAVIPVVALLALFPLGLVPLGIVSLVVLAGSGSPTPWQRPTDLLETSGRWLIGAVLAFLLGLAVAAIDAEGTNQELSEFGWALWFGSWMTALVLGVFGVLLSVARVTRSMTND